MTKWILACTLAASLVSVAQAAPAAKQAVDASAQVMAPEPAVPFPPKLLDTWVTFHLAHCGPGGTYPADPDCALFYKGKYHLHYIYQKGRYNHCYAHVSSPDMVHWKWEPTSL